MVCYHIELSPETKQLCTIVLTWLNYKYQKLTMDICNSPYIFQEKIYKLFELFDTVRSYIYYVLVIAKKDFTDHLKALDKVLQKLAEAGLTVNIERLFPGKMETKYLGFRTLGEAPIVQIDA